MSKPLFKKTKPETCAFVTKMYFSNKSYANKVAEIRTVEKGKIVSGHLKPH